MSIVVIGLGKLNDTLKALEKSAGRHAKSAYIAGGKLVEGEAKKSIMETSPGREVTRTRKGGKSYSHIAAAAGNAPNNDTGDLARSINTEVVSDGVLVGTNLQYGKHLEFGTKKMGARPWLMPALTKKMDDIIKLQIGAVNKTIRDSINVI